LHEKSKSPKLRSSSNLGDEQRIVDFHEGQWFSRIIEVRGTIVIATNTSPGLTRACAGADLRGLFRADSSIRTLFFLPHLLLRGETQSFKHASEAGKE
jgi:hypothetical protein